MKPHCTAVENPPAHRAILHNVQTRALALAVSSFFILHSALGITLVSTNAHGVFSETLNTVIRFTPTNRVTIHNGGLFAGPAVTTNLVNGQFTIRNFAPGDYTVTLPLVPGRNSFLIAVPDNTNSYDITALMNPPASYIYTNRLLNISQQVLPGTGLTAVTNNTGSVNETLTLNADVSSLVTTNQWAATNTALQTQIAGKVSTNDSRTVAFGEIAGTGLLLNVGANNDVNIGGAASSITIASGFSIYKTGGSDQYVEDLNGVMRMKSFSGDGSGLTNLNAANLASGTLPNARLGATVVTNVAQTTNSAGVASIANNVLSIGTNVPASSSGGLTNGQNAVTLGSTTFTNGVTMGRTNDGQSGLTWMTVQSSNSPSTFNFTMAATPYSATNPVDNVCYWGWNVAPGGGLGVAGEAALYYGIERDWYGTFETYMDVAPVSNSWYRPEFWSIDRTNGYCQKLERLDEWQLLSGSGTHNSQIWLVNSNGFNYYAPSRFGTTGTSTNNWVCFYGYSGSQQVTISNGLVGVGDFTAPGICGGTVNGAPGVFVSDYTKTNATSLQVRDIVVASSTGVRQMLISGTQLYPNSTLTINVTNAAQSGVTINGDKPSDTPPSVVFRTNTVFVGEVSVATRSSDILTGDVAGDLDIWGYRATSINFAANGSTINTRFYATSNWFGGNQYVGGSVIATSLLATNAVALTAKASGPTFAQMGIATNTGFFWSSNSTPPTLYWSYFDGSSNRVDTAK